ncbi:sodium-dependent transporter bedraggled isoform X2 [Vespula pensylvanica]|uniref:sodium-dependent transporter bedraggled isoform X2 n=1 Tax=Vespula pensylvanica TaxID=30213 RepID=UPI001CBA48E1|nr:sodium-dependent transporter bedraggled isoform X2 [Vespula pensylvanica]
MFLSGLNALSFLNVTIEFLRKLGGNFRKMASEDCDLIDLGNDVCVPRVSLTDPTPEEQEHLLDVCPPKLEQKLSLTVKQEQVQNDSDNGDVLVTLGHDQVVPIRKRIDVVSSDTIKRIRDITRNLEPVIRRTCSGIIQDHRDIVDHASSEIINTSEEETFEAQEINSAFDFLAEHEDNEDHSETNQDDVAGSNRSISSSAIPLIEKNESSSLENRRRRNSDSYEDIELDNPAFESSLYEVSSSSRTVANSCFVDFDLELREKCKRRAQDESMFLRDTKRRSFQSVVHRKSWAEGTKGHGSKDSGRVNRSVSLEESGQSCEPVDFFTGKTPDEESTIRSEEACSECSEVDWSWLEEVESLRASETSGHGAGSAANERFELVGRNASPVNEKTERKRDTEDRFEEASRSAAMSVTASTGKSLVDSLSRSDNVDRQNNNNNSNNSNNNSSNNGIYVGSANNDDIETELRFDSSNELESNNNNVGNNRVTNSWVRASMRRLRHLRLPEGTLEHRQRNVEPTNRRTAIVSAPNSLPDIALIAPEILAAQTNGTSGHHLRPSSAPAVRNNASNVAISNTNSTNGSGIVVVVGGGSGAGAGGGGGSGSGGNGNVATPRRPGRQHGGAVTNTTTSNAPTSVATPSARSRCASNAVRDTTSSGQSSVASTTTGSDATGSSGTTTCSSSSNGSPASTATSPQRAASRRTCERQRGVDRDADRGEDDDEDENPLGRWPHALSPALACLGCTLGLFNISRFAILSIQFGANFIVQFLILSLVLGIPLLTLQVCLGQRLATGSVDMWKISPLFQGVGIALLTAQAFIGIYSIVGVSWMFVYFRDSFITKQDRYRWAEPFLLYREDSRPTHNSSTTYKLYETVPDYFSGAVLQRHHLNEPDPGVVTLKFQVAFNLAVVWMIVFVSLSKGLRSYGKVVYVFTLVPVFGTLILCTKLLGLTPPGSIHQLFPATVWNEFFINGKSWVAASTEVFLTWGLLGAAAMQIAAHNKHKHLLQRDTSLVVVLTFVVLLLAAFLANTCVQILKHHGYIYTTSSFERISGYTFMRLVNQPAPSWYTSTPERFMSHASFLVGQRVTRPGADVSIESGYQVLRLSTELVPATLALLGTEQVSPFWAVLFYFILILFGIAQQLAIWHCVITGIMAINTKMMKLWETTITFFSCACAYILGLPMATELGIYVVYYLDYTVGGAWWIMVLYLVQVGAVFAVRGRPHSGEAVVAELFPPTGRCLRHWAGPLLSFTWNVILPVTLMVLSITVFKNNGFRELYSYRRTSRDYWAVWARQLGAAIQLIPILTIPAVAIIQTCRYLNNGPPDIFDRIQLLYRPALETDDPADAHTQIGNDTSTSIHGNGILPTTTDVPFEDPPPKYTPPPSYTTATGARIAKMLRQSFRRSVRRIANVLGESSAPRQRPALQPPPPDYATVLVEMNQNSHARDVSIHMNNESRPDVVVTNVRSGRNGRSATVVGIDERHRPNTIDRMTRIDSLDGNRRITVERTHSTLERGTRSRGCNVSNSNSLTSASTNLTAADVANLLRSSIRRGTARTQQSLRRSFCHDEPTAAVSVQNLVEAAAPIGQDSLVLPKDVSLVPNEHVDDDREDKKTADEMENSVSVI